MNGAAFVRGAVAALPPYRGLAGARPPVRLDGNENPLGPPPAALAALRALDPEVLSRYPDPRPLRTRWAGALGVAPEQLLLTSGSGPALAILAELALGPDDACVLTAPSFELYAWAALRREARVAAVPCGPRFAFPAAAFRRAVRTTGARLAFVGFPDNPTGRSPSAIQVERLAASFPETLFVLDEAYAEFTGESVIPLARCAPNVVVTRTFSKALGLAGLRVGGVIGDDGLIELLARINVPYPVTGPAVALALAALDDGTHVQRAVRGARAAVRRIAHAARRFGIPAMATRANFALLDLGSARRAARVTVALARRGVAVRDRSHLPQMAGWIRVSAGTPDEIERFVAALAAVMPRAPRPAPRVRRRRR